MKKCVARALDAFAAANPQKNCADFPTGYVFKTLKVEEKPPMFV
jgi:hypothetical protein